MSHPLSSSRGRLLSGQLEGKQARKLVRTVKRYSGLDLAKFLDGKLLTIYWYSRAYEKRRRESPLAFSRRWERSIYLETPMVEHVPKDCLAFVLLHELGHLVRGVSEKEATGYALDLLMKAKILSRERIEEINRGWRLARRTPSVRKRMRLLAKFIDAKANKDDLFEMAMVSILDRPDVA